MEEIKLILENENEGSINTVTLLEIIEKLIYLSKKSKINSIEINYKKTVSEDTI